ncbi:MAG: hypothetical protein HC921_06520 [Synechococcaceae cyanobacterium SM2_3_1]|nr:hypothetical protein [Synechococcaceae cyanobacterium SM2_3_1]
MSDPNPSRSPSSLRSPGQLNLLVGFTMLVAALSLGVILDQTDPLLPDPPPLPDTGEPIDWSTIPVERFAWRLFYAYLGFMGILNLTAGGGLLLMGNRLRARRLLSWCFLIGGVVHPGSWALVGLTEMRAWRWLGRIGFFAVLLAFSLMFAQLLFGIWRLSRHQSLRKWD